MTTSNDEIEAATTPLAPGVYPSSAAPLDPESLPGSARPSTASNPRTPPRSRPPSARFPTGTAISPMFQVEIEKAYLNSTPYSSPHPSEVQSAYGFSNITFGTVKGNTAGETIAVVDAQDDPNNPSDVNTFSAEYGLPAMTASTLSRVNQTGGTSYPATDSTGGWETEESLTSSGGTHRPGQHHPRRGRAPRAARTCSRRSATPRPCERRVDELGRQRVRRARRRTTLTSPPPGSPTSPRLGDSVCGATWPAVANVVGVGGTDA